MQKKNQYNIQNTFYMPVDELVVFDMKFANAPEKDTIEN